MKLVNILAGAALAVSAFSTAAPPAGAVTLPVTLGFTNITANSVADAATGEAQLRVELNCAAPSVSLKFTNAGPAASSITDIYIDESALLNPGTITDGPGVDFEWGASPGDLPGGNNASPPFEGTRHLDADSNAPTQPNGVNPGEFVIVNYTLLNGKTCASLSDDFDSGAFRIGIHVQGFSGGGSESFVNGPPPPPPTNTAPNCAVSGNVFTISDAEGLGTITGTATNVMTNPALPFNTNGATSATITASVIDQYADAALQLTVADKDGLTTNCNFSQVATPRPDTTKPYCALAQQIKGPPAQLIIHVKDAESGVKEIKALKATNLTLNPVFSTTQPYNANGTKDLIVVTATKVNQSLSAQLQLRVTDMAGNFIDCDPVITTATRGTGAPVESETWTITRVERWITLDGNAGVMSIKFDVNGKTFAASVREGERQVIDIASALVDGDNKVSLRSSGKPGSEVDVMIADEVAPED